MYALRILECAVWNFCRGGQHFGVAVGRRTGPIGLCIYALSFSGFDPCTDVADLLVVIGWGQVVLAIVVQEVQDDSLGHRHSLLIIEMNFLTPDVLPPIRVPVVGGPTYLPLPHCGAEDPLSARGPGVLTVVHVHAKPVKLWRVLGLLVLLLALDVEDHDLVGQGAELIREVPLWGVIIPTVVRVGGL